MGRIDPERLFKAITDRFELLGPAGHELIRGQPVTVVNGEVVATDDAGIGYMIESVEAGLMLSLDKETREVFPHTEQPED